MIFSNHFKKKNNITSDKIEIDNSIARNIRSRFKFAKIYTSNKKIDAFKIVIEIFPLDDGFLRDSAQAYKDIADYDNAIIVYKKYMN